MNTKTNELPEWATSAPPSPRPAVEYQLTVFEDQTSVHAYSPDLTPEEYRELAKRLAELRGYSVDQDASESPDEDGEEEGEEASVPAWVDGAIEYRLNSFSSATGHDIFDIELTGPEFELFKQTLAKLRGHVEEDESDKTEELATDDKPVVLRKTKAPGERLVMQALINYTQTAFEDWLKVRGTAADLYLLHQAFLHAYSDPKSLADQILEELDITLPAQKEVNHHV